TAKVWDVATGESVLTLQGHFDQVNFASYSPDGKRIVTGSEDLVVRLWDALSGRELLQLKGHTDGVLSAVFSPSGRSILTGSEDHTARLWRAAELEQEAAWESEEKLAARELGDGRNRLAANEQRTKVKLNGEGAIKQWLILAPIALPTDQSGVEALEYVQQIPN